MDDHRAPRKRRRLCPCCNQMLAKTTYWEHQKRFCGESAAGDRSDDTDGESDFSLESDVESVYELDATVQEYEDHGEEEDLELSVEGNKMTQLECAYTTPGTTPIQTWHMILNC